MGPEPRCENPICKAPCSGRDVSCYRCWAHPATNRRCHCADFESKQAQGYIDGGSMTIDVTP